jgi:hypothetical protein
MADGDVAANLQGSGIVGDMQRGIILHIGSLADSDRANISTHNGIEPHARIGSDPHITYDTSPVCQKYSFMNLGMNSPVRQNTFHSYWVTPYKQDIC